MEKAAFSIESYHFNNVNINTENHFSSDLSLNFETSGKFNSDEKTFNLNFIVSVFNEDKIDLPFVKVSCNGIFKFENVNSINEIPDFFYRNAIAIVFPYVRAYVSLITNQANVPGIILPTLNLSGLEQDLRNNTI